MISSFGRKLTFVLDPFSTILKKLGISPNTLTIIGLIMSLGAGFCFAIGSFICASLSLIAAGLCDIMDGKLARIEKTINFGAFLDSSLDRYSDSFVFCGIAYYYVGKSEVLVILSLCSLIGAFLTSYTKARAEKWIEMESVGIIERPERIALLIIGGLLRMDIVLWLLAIFGNITVLERIFYVKKHLKN